MTLDELKLKAFDLRAEGASWRTIAAELGYSRTSIQRWFDPKMKQAYNRLRRERLRTPIGNAKQRLTASRTNARRLGHKPCNATPEFIASSRTIVCPLCNSNDRKMVVDHDHLTGRFRGWICSDCNRAIGYAHESVLVLQRMVDHLS